MSNLKTNAQALFGRSPLTIAQEKALAAQQAGGNVQQDMPLDGGADTSVTVDANGNRFNAEGKRLVKGKDGREYEANEFWLNPVIPQQVVTVNEQGEEVLETKFTKMPVGVALGTMKPREYVTGANAGSVNAMIRAENKFLADTKALAETLEPGTSMVVMMPVEIRRVGTPVVSLPEDDALLQGVENFFTNLDRIA